jgi:hypothetical protein
MKAKVILIAVSLIASLGILSAQATKSQAPKSESKKTCYVDANNNNLCDKHEDKTCNGNGKGLRDGSGRKNGNGNGAGQGLRDGSGRKNGNGKGKGNGPNFVDANNDGVCDHNEVKK